MYTFPAQAIVDCDMGFRYIFRRWSGSAHDAEAKDISELSATLKDGKMKQKFWLAGGADYMRINGLLNLFLFRQF